MTVIWNDLFRKIIRIGARADDVPELREKKRLLVLGSLMFIAAGFVWGLTYILLGEWLAGVVPLTYCVLSSGGIFLFARGLGYHRFLLIQLWLMLLLPFLVMVALGSFHNSSAVILWSLAAPFGALVFDEPHHAIRWFVGFGALVGLGALTQPFLRVENQLPPAVVLLFFVMNIAGVSGAAFFLLFEFLTQRERAFRLLHLEQQKSENLLLNILPKEIAPRLKSNPGTIADSYDCASILFADIVNFTPWSAELPPDEMVEMLNEIFSYFDSLLDHYGVEKIRTIGDNYMCAAGVPLPRPDHAQTLARMALDMRAYIRSRSPRNGKQLNFRIGINSGPLVAGVIGTKKFVYDLWGDPVNVAARMESHSVPGKIQLGFATYQLIHNEFICEPRGILEVKGKGKMATWFLVGERKKSADNLSLR